MCKVGGPRCDDADLSKEDLHKLNLKRITDAESKIAEYGASDPRSDVWRSARYRAEVATRGEGEKLEDAGDVHQKVFGADGGGATYSPAGTSPRFGFSFSPYEERGLVIEDAVKKFEGDPKGFYRMLKKFEGNNKDLLSKQNHWVGLWLERDTGKLYVDISIVSATAETARKECLAHDQKAFFDMQSLYHDDPDGGEVMVNPDATSGQGKPDGS